MDAISRAWYIGSYTIAAKPIKTLELHYTMIQSHYTMLYQYGKRTRQFFGGVFISISV